MKTGIDSLGSSRSLGAQANALEKQLVLRRRHVRTVVTGARRKITTRLVSPISMLTAVGIGVAIEQSGRHRGWSLANTLNTAYAAIQLLLAVSTPSHQVNGTTRNKSNHEPTNR